MVVLKDSEKEVWVSVALTWVNVPNRLQFLESILVNKQSLESYRVVLDNINWNQLGVGSLKK